MATYTHSFSGLSGAVNSSAKTPRVNLGINLGAHERPTAITFSGYVGNSSHDIDEYIRLALCDTNGDNGHTLNSVYVGHATQAGSTWVTGIKDASGMNTTPSSASAWTDLRGKNLALRKLLDTDISVGIYGNVKVTVTTSVHTVTWSGANLSFSQNEYALTVTRSGSASDNWGGTITYRLYMDGVEIGTFSGTTKTITLTDADLEIAHTFRLDASGTASGSTIRVTGTTKSFTPASVHKTVVYYDGTQWVECVPYYYDGTGWQEVYPYYYDGTGWQLCSKT